MSNIDSLRAELQTQQERVMDLSSKLDEAQNELQARVEKSKQFANMRQMLSKKNAVVKQLRDQLRVNGISVADDLAATD